MKKIFCLVLLLISASGILAQSSPQPGSPGIGDLLYPGLGNGGYDVQHYTLDLTVAPQTDTLTGDVTIDATATEALSRFNLDLIGFTISQITVNGADATFSRSGQELTITPADPLADGAAFTAEVRYSGVPKRLTSVALPVQTGWVGYNGGNPNCPCSYVLSEPDGAADWFPVNDHPLDKATYTFHITVPKPYTVAANGDLQGVVDHGDTTTTTTEVTAPMASYLATVDISQFDLVTEPGTQSGVPIRNYFEKGVSQTTRALFDQQDAMIAYFETLFGKYPFDVYGAVMLNTRTGGALEAQTLSIFGTDTISRNNPESETIIAHELAHQWFGDSVSLGDWSDIWLNESFATYAEGLWIEHTSGKAGLQNWVQDIAQYITGDKSVVPPGKPPADDLFNAGVYYRGALLLHALRLTIGDAKFFQLLQTWASTYQYGNARTADFIALANQIGGQDLTTLFNAWLYAAQVPPLLQPASGVSA